MIENEVNQTIQSILERIKEYVKIHHDHAATCKFLTKKYQSGLDEIKNKQSAQAKSFVLWNKWFAPRILFEGIADPELLSLIEKLNELLHQLIDMENINRD